MPNVFGLIFWTVGVLSITFSIYIFNLILIRYFHNDKFKIYFYLSILFMFLFIILRIYSFFYIDNVKVSDLEDNVLLERIYFIRMIFRIPMAIAFTLLLIPCYECLGQIRFKSRYRVRDIKETKKVKTGLLFREHLEKLSNKGFHKSNIEPRLNELKHDYKLGLISKKEYSRAKKRIEKIKTTLNAELKVLKENYKLGLISKKEYSRAKKRIEKTFRNI